MPTPAAKNPPSFALRPVAPPDEGFLLRLYATTRAAELATTAWDAAQRDAFVRSQYQARRNDYATRFAGAEHSIITVGGQDAGVCMIRRSATEIRLVNIELLPEHRGQGIGGALLRQLRAEARDRNLPFMLSVRENNHAAIRLYRRLGFATHGREGGYVAMRSEP